MTKQQNEEMRKFRTDFDNFQEDIQATTRKIESGCRDNTITEADVQTDIDNLISAVNVFKLKHGPTET